MPTETKDRDLQEIGRSAFASIQEMVTALECDYDRLTELRDERANLEESALQAWDEENGEELKDLADTAGDCTSREEAEERIHEDPLSVEVRSGWTSVGELMEAEEFVILLGTGGPAIRIRGELDDGQPSRAWLEVQDWFTPWTEYIGASQDVLLTYAQQFYFGEH